MKRNKKSNKKIDKSKKWKEKIQKGSLSCTIIEYHLQIIKFFKTANISKLRLEQSVSKEVLVTGPKFQAEIPERQIVDHPPSENEVIPS